MNKISRKKMRSIVLDAIAQQTFRHGSIQNQRVIHWDDVEAATHSRCSAIDPEIDAYFYDYFDDVKRVEMREDLEIERQLGEIDSLRFELYSMRRLLNKPAAHHQTINYGQQSALIRSVNDALVRANRILGVKTK
jgi:hypothetical protein